MQVEWKTSLTMPLGVCYAPYGMTENGQNEMTPMTGSDIVCWLIAIAVFAVDSPYAQGRSPWLL